MDTKAQVEKIRALTVQLNGLIRDELVDVNKPFYVKHRGNFELAEGLQQLYGDIGWWLSGQGKK